MSQEELAREIGIAQQHISRWENNSHDPAANVVRRLALVLKVPAGYLLGIEDSMGDSPDVKELSPMQRKLLWAAEKGYITETYEALASLSKRED